MKKLTFKSFLIFLFFAFLIPLPVHAYAGPGAAIGVIIVFLTVVFAFFASSLISLFKFTKKMFLKLHKKISLINKKQKYKK